MSREIMRSLKFRAWDKDGYIKQISFKNEENMYFSPYNLFLIKPEIRRDVVLEQYTGLKDKNGKEIYEGDIVNIQGIKYYVDFEHGGFWFNNDNRKWKANRPFTHFQEINDTEVIGNIHENPELMEDGNE